MKRTSLITFGLVFVFSIAFAAIRLWAPYYLETLELRALDFRLQVRGPVSGSDEVVIVGVDEKSLAKVGRWPWPRSYIATLLSQLTALDAAVVGMDIVFAEPQPEHDQPLAEAIRQSGKVVLGYFLDFAQDVAPQLSAPTGVGLVSESPHDAALAVSEYNLIRPQESIGRRRLQSAPRVVSNIPALSASSRQAGYFNFSPDVDGMYRRFPLAIEHQGKILTPLSLEVLRRYLGAPLLAIYFEDYGVETVRLARQDLPADETGSMWINYTGPAQSFRHYSASDVIDGSVPADAIAGKIVLVGTTAVGTYDLRATPFDPTLPGVEIHANVIDNILRGRFLIRPQWLIAADMSIIVGLGLLIGVILRRLRGLWGGLLTVGILGAYLWSSQLFFESDGVPLSVIYPLLLGLTVYPSVTLFHYMTEEREKRQIRDAFSHYLHPEVARMVSQNPKLLQLGGEKRELSVMFTDIRGFTSVSEGLAPEALVEFLNEYLSAMTDIVFTHNGLLDKYIGDAVMALWGAPLSDAEHARKACRTGLDMMAALHKLRASWDKRGLPPIDIGVGINTGDMVVGNMGSNRRFDYTVMGDNVNLASRLEGLNKMYGTHILLSESTLAQLGDEFVVREIDAVRVKGKLQPVTIFELLGLATNASTSKPLVCGFAEALDAYKAQQWDTARQRFSDLAAQYPDDGPTQVYQERCQQLILTPPPPDWDGVFVMETK